ncbi:hypothetical protein CspHIS471_0701740 [Cutaneotrichosporon sp. HIS471]|nr:hypothetical protein CspHIS471_0701740 [Cutaneotrichosporon sp. HIS471]
MLQQKLSTSKMTRSFWYRVGNRATIRICGRHASPSEAVWRCYAYGFALAEERHAFTIPAGRSFTFFSGPSLIAFVRIFFFSIVVPDTPEKARFLDDREMLNTCERLLSNLRSIDENYFGWHQV